MDTKETTRNVIICSFAQETFLVIVEEEIRI
jgi:hypothetical protein